MNFLLDTVQCGILPLPEITRRYQAGEVAQRLFVRALCGRIAQDEADKLPDGDSTRDLLLDFVGDTEEWFQDAFRKYAATY